MNEEKKPRVPQQGYPSDCVKIQREEEEDDFEIWEDDDFEDEEEDD